VIRRKNGVGVAEKGDGFSLLMSLEEVMVSDITVFNDSVEGENAFQFFEDHGADPIDPLLIEGVRVDFTETD